MTTDDKLAVSQEARAELIDAILGDYHTTRLLGTPASAHILTKHRSKEAFARFEAQARLAGERAGMERAAGIAFDRLYPKNHEGDWTEYASDMAGAARRAKEAILKEAASITPPPPGA
jgi:hypothetical protein